MKVLTLRTTADGQNAHYSGETPGKRTTKPRSYVDTSPPLSPADNAGGEGSRSGRQGGGLSLYCSLGVAEEGESESHIVPFELFIPTQQWEAASQFSYSAELFHTCIS
jgi:hypothetical protein